jgi:hypothetical protein
MRRHRSYFGATMELRNVWASQTSGKKELKSGSDEGLRENRRGDGAEIPAFTSRRVDAGVVRRHRGIK